MSLNVDWDKIRWGGLKKNRGKNPKPIKNNAANASKRTFKGLSLKEAKEKLLKASR